MKKIFIFINIIYLFGYGNIIENSEVKEQITEDYFRNNINIPIPTLKYKAEKFNIISKINKEILGESFNTKGVAIVNDKEYKLYENKNLIPQGSGFFQVACTKDDTLVLVITNYFFNQEAEFNGIFYNNNLYKIKNNTLEEEIIYNNLTGQYKYELGGYLFDLSNNTVYKYYTPKKLLNQLYKVGLCNKLEEDLNYYFDVIYVINEKSYLYKKPSEEFLTNMYLIAGDKADLLEEQIDKKGIKWYKILYQGKKNITAWIKANTSVNLDTEKE